LFVTLPQAEAVYISLRTRFWRPRCVVVPCPQGIPL